MRSRIRTTARCLAAVTIAVIVLATSLTACTAAFGGVAGIAVDSATGDILVITQLCAPTTKLSIELRTDTADTETGKTVRDAGGKAAGSRVVVNLAEPPAGWTRDVVGAVPQRKPLTLEVWSKPEGSEPHAISTRLSEVAFIAADLPRTSGESPTRMMYEEDNQPTMGDNKEFAAATKAACKES